MTEQQIEVFILEQVSSYRKFICKAFKSFTYEILLPLGLIRTTLARISGPYMHLRTSGECYQALVPCSLAACHIHVVANDAIDSAAAAFPLAKRRFRDHNSCG